MQNKEDLVRTIKKWVELDTSIREFQKKSSILKKQKAELGKNLINCMRENTIDCVKITGGELLYKKKVAKQPLTRKLIDQLLGKYYEHDLAEAEKLKEFLQENRVNRTTESITRKETAVAPNPDPVTI
jgi:hypothetical protein